MCAENEQTADGVEHKSELTGSAFKHRFTALYHNCKSSAAFALYDAACENDDVTWKAKRAEAAAYECCACWLKAAIDEMPNVRNDSR